ncbi:MAG: hypothetical protein ACMG6E_03385, partial [Candidatus Roizmanbacteria bacterium]
MKTIVTHIGPDIDAISSVWLLRKFKPGWVMADVAFVPAGKTLDDQEVDSNPTVLHVDTGMGKFDHHQSEEKTCAASLVLDHLLEIDAIKDKYREALERLVEVVRCFDNFEESSWEDADADWFQFCLPDILFGLKGMSYTNEEVIEMGEKMLESVFLLLQQKVYAEKDIESGFVFTSPWGRTLALESRNSQVAHVALKAGYDMILWKRPDDRA